MSIYPLALAVVALTATGAASGSVTDSLQACLAVEDPAQRLACFESVAKNAPTTQPSASQGAADAPKTQPPTSSDAAAPAAPQPTKAAAAEAATPPAANAEADFGREQRVAVKRAGERMDSTLVAVTRNGYGKLRVTLANGQIWEQVGSERFQLAVGDHVVIERGALQSFFLSKDSANRKVRFRRID